MKRVSELRNSNGFSLVELVVMLGLLTVVATGTSALLLDIQKKNNVMYSQGNLVSTLEMLNRSVSRNPAADSSLSCSNMMSFDGTFSPTGETNIRIALSPTEVYHAGKVLESTQLTIDRIYLANPIQLASTSTEKSYLTDIFMTASLGMQNKTHARPRSLGTVVVKVSATNQFMGCNLPIKTTEQNTICNGLEGMVWNEAEGKCNQEVTSNPDFTLTCPPATKLIGGECKPQPSSCATKQLAKAFSRGRVQNCQEPPLNEAVGIPSPPATIVAEGAPPPSTPTPTPIPYSPPPVVSAPNPPAQPPAPPASCQDGTLLGESNYQQCADYEGCLQGNRQPAGDQCEVEKVEPYTPPPPVAVPDPAPPADLTCQCQNYRINNGEYCMYCAANVDLGYGWVDYAYGVAQCVNGNLSDVPAAQAPTVVPNCGTDGGYKRARLGVDGFYRPYMDP